MASPDIEQYPAVRSMKVCLACGGGKDIGLLVCWPCHNNLKAAHDGQYGPTMERVIAKAQAEADKHRPEC